MKKLGYIRVSTDKQVTDRQIDQLEKVCDQLFIEGAISAVGKARPAYDALIKALVPGDEFVVLAVDRAYRSVLEALTELEKLHQRNITFCSLSQTFDTKTPEGMFQYTLYAALAEHERAVLINRTREGMVAAQQRGRTLGRPRKLTEQVVSGVKAVLSQAHHPDINEVSSELNVSPRTLKRALNAHEDEQSEI